MTYDDEEISYQNDAAFHQQLIADVLAAYPNKSRKRPQKHLNVAKPAGEEAQAEGTLTECDVKSNIKSIPGRGIAYGFRLTGQTPWAGWFRTECCEIVSH